MSFHNMGLVLVWEDNDMVKFNLNPYYKIQIRYSKPDSTARDNRSLNQEARAVFHYNFETSPWQDGAAVRDGVMGPCPLLRIADFVGYDECRRPGASARVEQKPNLFSENFVFPARVENLTTF